MSFLGAAARRVGRVDVSGKNTGGRMEDRAAALPAVKQRPGGCPA